VPVVLRQPGTVLAVNLDGAVIPIALSVYLLIDDDVWWQAAVAVVFVAALVHFSARPVPGLGIAVPALVPRSWPPAPQSCCRRAPRRR
jgi:uncharacterized membrane protein